MKTDTPVFWKLFKPKACALKLKSDEQQALFEELVDGLVKASLLTAEQRDPVVAALVNRERLASTGLGLGVAIPHVPIEGLTEPVVSLSIHPAGIDWRAIDGAPVQIFFTVLRPTEESDGFDPEQHVEMMRWIGRLARHDDFRRFALVASTRTELTGLLKEMAGV